MIKRLVDGFRSANLNSDLFLGDEKGHFFRINVTHG